MSMESKLHRILITKKSILNEATKKQLEYTAQQNSAQIQFFDSTNSNVEEILESKNQNSSTNSETSNESKIYQTPNINVNHGEQLATALIQDTDLSLQNVHNGNQQTNLPFHENIHRNQLLWYLFQEYLTQNEIDSVVFFNVPEGLNESILYQVAKVLDIFVLILCQSPFSNRFFSFCSLQDCGQYETNADVTDDFWDRIENVSTKRQIQQSQIKCKGSSAREILRIFWFLFKVRSLKLLNPLYLVRHAKHLHDAPANIELWKDPFAKFFYCQSVAYFEFFSRGHTGKVDLNQHYVYFPIQPLTELHSEMLTNYFGDQLLALEQLVSILPQDYKIFIKSDLNQDSDFLTPMFFHRVRRIKNVVRLPSCFESEQLIVNSEFVATVSSRDGWEALSRGKKVLVFGKPWYRKLPGAYEYCRDLEYREITESKFNSSDFLRHTNFIYQRSHAGFLNSVVENDSVENDEIENATQIAATILELTLGRIIPTFQKACA